MPPALAYATEAELAAYMALVIGTAADALGWTVTAGSYQLAVNRTLRAAGVATITDVPATSAGVAALEALATYHVWRAVADAAAGLISHSLDQQSFSLKEVSANATAALVRAREDLRQLGLDASGATAATATVGRVDSLAWPTDPYVVRRHPPGASGAGGAG